MNKVVLLILNFNVFDFEIISHTINEYFGITANI